MVVNMYNFQKKNNSTAQPIATTGTIFSSVQLKESTSVISPILLFNPSSPGMEPFSPSKFNYAYLPQFSRYYFINDWKWINGLWECYLTVDVLASYKTGIGTLSEYVTRAASAYDGSISDTLYPTNTGFYRNRSLFSNRFDNTGVYVVGIINNSANAVDGAVTYYLMTNAQVGQLKTYLMSETFLSLNGLSNLQEMSKDLVKAVFNPFQYIVSCRFFPVAYSSAIAHATAVSAIEIGWWQISTVSAYRMPAGLYIDLESDAVTVGSHPQAATRGDYLNHAPYTERVLIHPMLGTVSLDSNKITGGQTIKVFFRIDMTTGECEAYVENTTEQITLYRTSIRACIDVQLAQIATDHIAVAQSAVDTVGSAIGTALSGNLLGAVTGAGSGILNALAASQPVMQTSGTNGNRTVYHIAPALYDFYRVLVDEDQAHRGRPLCKVKTINTLSGYIKCSDAHAELSCFAEERNMIIEFMNNGFYYE